MRRAAAVGALLQLAVAGLGHLIPAARDAGLFPFAGTTIGALAGLRFSRRARGVPIGTSLGRGAVAGGFGGALGALAAAFLGDLPANAILVAGVSTALAGAVGGLGGRFLPRRDAG
jgi:hypothetical protein